MLGFGVVLFLDLVKNELLLHGVPSSDDPLAFLQLISEHRAGEARFKLGTYQPP